MSVFGIHEEDVARQQEPGAGEDSFLRPHSPQDHDSLDDYMTARDGMSQDEEEMPNAPAGPVTHFSREAPQREFDPAQWRTGRTDRVMGKYLSTFGERKRAAGGGIGGFFKALFGRGMARANRRAERSAYAQSVIQGSREQRGQAVAQNGPARSALRTRLAGPPIRNLSTFPREPGVVYDEQAAGQAHADFMANRRAYHSLEGEENVVESKDEDEGQDEVAAAGDIMFGNLANSVGGRANDVARLQRRANREAEQRMKEAYQGYDVGAGNQTLFGHNRRNPYDDKYRGLANANLKAGEEIYNLDQRPRRVPQRVRFKDGADDAVGQPVNDDAAGPENKAMPTSVRFFGAPIGSRTLRRDLDSRYAALKRTPEFQALTPEEREERKAALQQESAASIKTYVDSLGEVGHPDHISDEQAMDQAQFAWPVRAQMLRMTSDERFHAAGQHDVNAMNAEARANLAGIDPLESDEFRDQYLRSQIGGEVERDLQRKARKDEEHRSKRTTDTTYLGHQVKSEASGILSAHGKRVDPNVDLTTQVPRLPRHYYDVFLENGYRNADAAANGGGLIEEEKEP